MASTVKTREDDETVLTMIALREIGYSSAQVGHMYGITGSRVRTITNRVMKYVRDEEC